MILETLQLQSGFVIAPMFKLNRDIRPDLDVKDEVLDRVADSTSYNFYYSAEVSELAGQAAANPLIVNNFEWQEKLLKEYIRFFSKYGLLNWVSMQLHNPYVPGYNIKYLDETLRWLVMSEPRIIKNVQWFRGLFPLRHGDNVNQDRPKIDLSIYSTGVFRNLDFEEQISGLWLSRPDGMAELLGFMNNVFGQRNPNATGFM